MWRVEFRDEASLGGWRRVHYAGESQARGVVAALARSGRLAIVERICARPYARVLEGGCVL